MKTLHQISHIKKQRLFRNVRWIVEMFLISIFLIGIILNVYTSFRYGYMAAYEVSDKDFRNYKNDFDSATEYLLSFIDNCDNSDFSYLSVSFSSNTQNLIFDWFFNDNKKNYTQEIELSDQLKKSFDGIRTAFSKNSNYGYLDSIIVKTNSVVYGRQSYKLIYSTDWFQAGDDGRHMERRSLHWFHSIHKIQLT